MPLESDFSYIDLLNTNWPNDTPDQLAEADDHLRGIKTALQGSFPNLGQLAVTKTAAEINALINSNSPVINTPVINGQTLNADGAELDLLDGVTAGTMTVSKALSVDGSGTLDALDITNSTATDLAIGGTPVNHPGQGYGGRVLIETATASTSSSIDFGTGIDSTYKKYIIEVINATPSANAIFRFRGMVSGVPQSGGTDYKTGSTSSNRIDISLDVASGAAVGGLSLVIQVHNPAAAGSVDMHVITDGMYSAATINDVNTYNNVAVYQGGSAIDGFTINTSTGTISTGEFRLYGVIV